MGKGSPNNFNGREGGEHEYTPILSRQDGPSWPDKVLSRELAPEVTVNWIMPGRIMTERQRELLAFKAEELGITLEQMEEEASEEIPLRRFGKPEEVGDLIAFLCSERASYISGALIPIDGGMLTVVG
jgi:3-oxoacyl-[acyl-carrier protein] reductase